MDAVLITNGFDPEETEKAGEADGLLDPERRSFVHTGRLSLAHISVGPLLAALRLLAADDPEQAKQLEVVFAGSLTDEERRALAAPDLAGTSASWMARAPEGPSTAAGRRRAPRRDRRGRAAKRRDRQAVRVPRERPADPRARRRDGGGPDRRRDRLGPQRAGVRPARDRRRAAAPCSEAPSARPNADAVAAYAYPVLAGALAKTIEPSSHGSTAAADPLDTVECNGG